MKPLLSFDPERDAEALRAMLNAPRYPKLSTDRLLYRAKAFADANKYRFKISRPTVERFKQGEMPTEADVVETLAAIWAYLQSESARSPLLAVNTTEEEAPVVKRTSTALSEYFSSGPGTVASLNLGESAYQLAGYYGMYRRHWEQPGKIHLSIFALKIGDEGTLAQEFTNAAAPDGGLLWYQASEGFLMARGAFMHFLMREAYGAGVLFGTIETYAPFTAVSQVMRMTGVLSGAAHQTLLPGTRFFCRRCDPGAEPRTGVFDPVDINDGEVLAHLGLPL